MRFAGDRSIFAHVPTMKTMFPCSNIQQQAPEGRPSSSGCGAFSSRLSALPHHVIRVSHWLIWFVLLGPWATVRGQIPTELPRITDHPVSQTAVVGSRVAFYIGASGGGGTVPAVQWYKNSVAIPGATTGALFLNAVTFGDAGLYSCGISNSVGTVFTNTATLTVIESSQNGFPPIITLPPASQTVVRGGRVTFTVMAEGPGPFTYQWSKGGVALSGATANTLAIAAARDEDAGSYTVRVLGGAGSIVSQPAVLAVTEVSVPGSKLGNLSVRQKIVAGGQLLAGLTIVGDQPKLILIRGVGPTLGNFGVTEFMTDPQIEVFSGNLKIAENDSWPASLGQIFPKAGAFALPTGSRDAAVVLSLNPGGYTVQVRAADSGSGEVLFEAYELTP